MARDVLSLTLLGMAAALGLTSMSSTAGADPPEAPIIPDEEEKSAGPTLPAPYEAWPGRGHALPGAHRDGPLPAPLARPRELPRRPLEVALGGAAFLPSCSAGSFDDRGCVTLRPGAGAEGALLYRVGPFFAAGAEGAWSGFAARGHGALSGAAGSGGFAGVTGRVYFAEGGAWDPHVSLALGYSALRLSQGGAVTSGFGARVGGGIDFSISSHVRLGPALAFTHFVAWREERCEGAVCRQGRASYGRLLGYATLGLRLTASFGDAL